MNALQIYSYEGSAITFELENGDVMVNITEMAKPFGKDPYGFLRTEQARQFIKVLEERVSPQICGVVKTITGGTNPGTWAHQKLALKFAGWLNPHFELWVYDRIEELLKNGYTKLDAISRKELAMLLLESEEEKERIQQTATLQAKQLTEAAPKVAYYENVLQSDSLIATNVIAKEMGMSAVTLNRMLNKLGIIYRSSDTWVLYHRFQNMGYTGTKTFSYKSSLGEDRTNVQMYWTEKGRQFIHNLIDKKYANLQQKAG